jgi:hypothetical protein
MLSALLAMVQGNLYHYSPPPPSSVAHKSTALFHLSGRTRFKDLKKRQGEDLEEEHKPSNKGKIKVEITAQCE